MLHALDKVKIYTRSEQGQTHSWYIHTENAKHSHHLIISFEFKHYSGSETEAGEKDEKRAGQEKIGKTGRDGHQI